MIARLVLLVLAQVALLYPAAHATEYELPPFTLHVSAGTTIVPGDEVFIQVSSKGGVRLYGHPFDRLVGLFAVEDLDGNLRPTGEPEYSAVELDPDGRGRLIQSIPAPEEPGEYAVVPYPDVVGALPAGVDYPDPAVFVVQPLASAPQGPAPEMEASDVVGLAAVAVFAVLMILLGRRLRRAEREGDYDPDGSSPASRPGLRLFFDYSEDGWRNDGSRQHPDE